MDDPVAEITDVILALTTTPPSVQQTAIDKYFTQDAEFVHPFCRTIPSRTSRYQLSRIYRWYKIMSPKISLKVHSISWDRENDILYVGITQIFAIWAIPMHEARVSLVTVLQLVKVNNHLGSPGGSTGSREKHGTGNAKWYIKSQNDLYQTDQWLKFLLSSSFAGIAVLWQYLATIGCVLLSYLFAPVTWWEEHRQTRFQRDQPPGPWNAAK